MQSFDDAADVTGPTETDILYARILPRFKALVFDLFVYVVAITLLVIVASAATTALMIRSVGATLILILLLYEPIMVWRFGGTLGHMRYNLRVVSDRTGGNPSFIASIGRWWVKGLLGVLSFFLMALTRRHQALHDALSRSTVQVRERAEADPIDFVLERTEPVGATDVSALRRTVVIIVYEGILLFALSIGSLPFVSEACAYQNICTAGEDIGLAVIDGLWLVTAGALVILGWKGWLWGARGRTSSTVAARRLSRRATD